MTLDGKWRRMQKLLHGNDPSLFFVDTEFATSRTLGRVMLEVAVMDAKGRVILDTRISYGCTWKYFWDEYGLAPPSRLNTCAYRMAPADPVEEMQGCTLNEGCKLLAEVGINTDSNWVEWNDSHCDTTLIRGAMERSNLGHLAPDVELTFSPIGLFKIVLPGFWSYSLPELFPMLLPEDEDAKESHFALVDTRKMWKLCKLAFAHPSLQNSSI